jgi:adenine-specific DNA-methyltransferase
MAKTYKGSLSLEWYNKQKSIMIKADDVVGSAKDIPAPIMNWVNKDEALFYEILDEEGRGLKPYWVDRNDIRIKEARPLIIQKTFRAVQKDKPGTIAGTSLVWELEELKEDLQQVENILIKGDNVLALNTLKKLFEIKPEEEKAKCIFLDPPYNTGQAFDNYDDNLAQSEWLTLMRDRLEILHKLLRQDGVIFIQLDEKNVFHIRVILDEIFGKFNYVNLFTVKTSDPSGLKTVNPSPYDSAEYIIMYAKNKSSYKYQTQYVESDHDTGYSKYITNINEPYNKWNIVSVNEFYAKKLGHNTVDEAKKAKGKLDFLSEVAEFAIQNASSVFQLTAIADDAGREIVEVRDKSKATADKVFHLKREKDEVYILNGRQVYFYSNKVRIIDGKTVPTMLLTNIWTDIPYNGISKEGGVKFKESKKPEKLIRRILEVANTTEGDLVIDVFGGSGTTFAVSHKMNRKWIGVEIGNHADTHIIPRLKSVLTGSDKSGVTDSVKWQGGGSFKYYHLGSSIITQDENGVGDFNWSLGKKFIEESLLLSYDYLLDKSINFQAEQLFQNKEAQPTIGIQQIGNKTRVAIVSLNEPKGKLGIMPYEEIQAIYKTIKTKFAPEYINIFTNRGVEMAYDSKPDDLEVIKVPHAIFAELEK